MNIDFTKYLKQGGSLAAYLAKWAASATVGDIFHDWVDNIKGGKGDRKSDVQIGLDGEITEEISPPLGLSILTREDQYKYSRTYQQLPTDLQPHLQAGMIAYFVRPGDYGLISHSVSKYLHDQCMMQIVNRDTPSHSTGSTKTTSIETGFTPSTSREVTRDLLDASGNKVGTSTQASKRGEAKTETTTERHQAHSTPGGNESLVLMTELANAWATGGIEAFERCLEHHKLPIVNEEWLKKADDFLKSLGPRAKDAVLAVRTKVPELVSKANDRIEANLVEMRASYDERQEKQKSRGRLGRLLNNI